jgi:hypothetical protein
VLKKVTISFKYNLQEQPSVVAQGRQGDLPLVYNMHNRVSRGIIVEVDRSGKAIAPTGDI